MTPDSRQGEVDELRAWASVGQTGMCVHSFFAPARGQGCAGCMVREALRALGALVDMHEQGFSTPTHGMPIEDEEHLWKVARSLYEMVEEVR